MGQETWRRVDRLFQQALRLETEERAHFLARCDEPTLRREVESMLAADADADEADFLALPFAGESATLPNRENSVSRIDRLGSYRLIGEIGRGGMGRVFLAERDDGEFQQRVAVKVIAAPATPGVLKRFRTERQILARLEHPYLARLIDGGMSEGGHLYLVMEWIDGAPIDLFCRRQDLRLRQRLRLFLDVCSAVSYAHQQLIVHRDLKPSNILVTGDGTPKLLDFGIAKVLEPALLPSQSALTVSGQRPMTPLYASPEQLVGGTITAATDVYGLGLLLFELLTGRRPFDLRGLSAGEAERRICEQDPPLPSRVASAGDAGAAAAGAAAVPRSIPPHLLEGDLDNIVTMALAKEPNRRYDSVRQMAEDIERHLERRPVSARTGDWVYRGTRYLQRNATVASFTAVVFFLLLLLVLTQRVQSKRLALERDQARLARTEAEHVSDYLVEIFSKADPIAARGREVSARELLEAGAEGISADFRHRPEVRARLVRTIADAYHGLGLHSEAIELLEPARVWAIETLGPADVRVGDMSVLLAYLWVWRNDVEKADAYAREAVSILTDALGEDDPKTLESLTALANVRDAAGELGQARELFQEIWTRRRAALGPDDLATVDSRMSIAQLDAEGGEYDRAAEAAAATLPALRSALGSDHPDLALALHNLGSYLSAASGGTDTELMERAELALREALEIRRESFDEDDPRTSKTEANLAGVYADLGDSRAVPLAERSLAARRRRLGDDHPQVANGLAVLGSVLRRLGRLDEAIERFEESAQVAERSMPAGQPARAHPLHALGEVLLEAGRAGEAEPVLRRALEIRQQTLPPGNRFVARTRRALGTCLLRLGRASEAAIFLRSALEMEVQIHGVDAPPVAALCGMLGGASSPSGLPAACTASAGSQTARSLELE